MSGSSCAMFSTEYRNAKVRQITLIGLLFLFCDNVTPVNFAFRNDLGKKDLIIIKYTKEENILCIEIFTVSIIV